MLDIHTHLLPNVDDGSRSLEQSISMIKQEIKEGVTEAIVTPHFYFHHYEASKEKILEAYELLNKEIAKQNLDFKLYLGQEICYTTQVDIIQMLKDGRLFTLNNSRYVLLEFRLGKRPEGIEDIVYQFSLHGYKVVIAHVERYDWIDYDLADYLFKEGAILQVNDDSIFNIRNFKKYRLTHKLLKKKKVSFIASDIHSFRPSRMKKAMKKYSKYLVNDCISLI